MGLAPASTLGGADAVAVAAEVAAAGGQDEDSNEQPHAEAPELRPWLVAYRHAAKTHVGNMCAVAASVRVVRRALRFRVLNERSLLCPLTSFGAGLASERGRWARVLLIWC